LWILILWMTCKVAITFASPLDRRSSHRMKDLVSIRLRNWRWMWRQWRDLVTAWTCRQISTVGAFIQTGSLSLQNHHHCSKLTQRNPIGITTMNIFRSRKFWWWLLQDLIDNPFFHSSYWQSLAWVALWMLIFSYRWLTNVTEDPNAAEVVKISSGMSIRVPCPLWRLISSIFSRTTLSCSTRQYQNIAWMHVSSQCLSY